MQIILASAKIMNKTTTVATPPSSQATFQKEAEQFALELSQWSAPELAQQLHCSLSIAQENKLRFEHFFDKSEYLPAILAYHGQAYKYLVAEDFKTEDFLFAQQHLFITSFLYGLLRPLDLIHPYRMEGKMKLETTSDQSFFAYWKPRLTQMLIDAVRADDGILVHLATEEFEHLFDWKRIEQEIRVIQPLFYVDDGHRMKVVSVHAKSCRGAMARFLLLNRLTKPEDMYPFQLNGFTYNARYGDENHPHFIME